MGSNEETTATDISKNPPTRVTRDCLLVIYSENRAFLGRRFVLEEAPMRIGREDGNDVVVGGHGVSRWHARVEFLGGAWVVMDVGSRNGTQLNQRPLDGQVALKNGDRIQVGSTLLKYLSGTDVESELLEEIYLIGVLDHMTGIYNRKHFDDTLDREFSQLDAISVRSV